MVLWLLQLAVDFLFFFMALNWLKTYRQLSRLERTVERHQKVLGEQILQACTPESSGAQAPQAKRQALLPYEKAGSVLSEKTVGQPRQERSARLPSLDAYDRADQLLSQGLEIAEVALRTGISVSELQLLGKIAQKNH